MTRRYRFFHSVADAGRGIRIAYARERNFRIQIFAGTIACVAAAIAGFGRGSWILLLLIICLVLVLELLNSAVEHMLDVLKPRLHEQVKLIKDVMAAAVLVASIGAAAIGFALFWPFLVELRAFL